MMNPAEKLQQIFQKVLGKNNPDAVRLTEEFEQAFGHSLDLVLVKHEQALHKQQAAIESLQSKTPPCGYSNPP
jgi:hypothetical protein